MPTSPWLGQLVWAVQVGHCPCYPNSDNIHITLTQTMSTLPELEQTVQAVQVGHCPSWKFSMRAGGVYIRQPVWAVYVGHYLHYPNLENVHITPSQTMSTSSELRQCPCYPTSDYLSGLSKLDIAHVENFLWAGGGNSDNLSGQSKLDIVQVENFLHGWGVSLDNFLSALPRTDNWRQTQGHTNIGLLTTNT